MKRRRMSKRKSKSLFSRTAKKVNKRNNIGGSPRGGYRL